MRRILTLLFCLVFTRATAQENLRAIADSIKAEGFKLYHSERASWIASDMLSERYHEDLNKIGGYFSYEEDAFEKCVFFSRDTLPKVLMTVLFDSSYDPQRAAVSMMARPFTAVEHELYAMRLAAFRALNSDTSFFKVFPNTNINFIPLVQGKARKVYLLTATDIAETVVFGNDYLLTFGENDQIVDKKQLHSTILPTTYGSKADTTQRMENVGTIHVYLPGSCDFMTATDICTFLLYSEYAKWPSCVTVSEHYTSIFQKRGNVLVIIKK